MPPPRALPVRRHERRLPLIQWETLFLIVGMFLSPLALQKTGGVGRGGPAPARWALAGPPD